MQKEVFSSESETGVYEIYGYAADKYITEFTDCTLTPQTGQNEINYYTSNRRGLA